MQNLTPQFFDTLIIVVIILGLAVAVVRLYRDFTRPLPPPKPYERPRAPRSTNRDTTNDKD